MLYSGSERAEAEMCRAELDGLIGQGYGSGIFMDRPFLSGVCVVLLPET